MLNHLQNILTQSIMRLGDIHLRKSKFLGDFRLNTLRGCASSGIAAFLFISWIQVNSFGYSDKLVGGKNSSMGFVTTTKLEPSTSPQKTIDFTRKRENAKPTVNALATTTKRVSSTSQKDPVEYSAKRDGGKTTGDGFASITQRESADSSTSADTVPLKHTLVETIQTPITDNVKVIETKPVGGDTGKPTILVPVDPPNVDLDRVPIQPPTDTPGDRIKLPAPHNVIKIKFHDGFRIRLVREDPRDRNSRLVPKDLNGKALTSPLAQEVLKKVEQGKWARTHIPNEKQLDELRAKTSKILGDQMPDLNLYFSLLLPKDIEAKEVIRWFKMLKEVESARLKPDYYLAVAPDYSEYQDGQTHTLGDTTYVVEDDYQRYLEPAPVGVDAYYAWQFPGGDGAGVSVVDIESAFDRNHPDLPQVTEDGTPFPGNIELKHINHGTATLGVIVGLDNGEGVKGIAHAATPYFISTRPFFNAAVGMDSDDPNADAYTDAIAWAVDLDSLLVNHIVAGEAQPGDVIVLEIQTDGPNSNPDDDSQDGLVPVEWHEDVWNAIRYATTNGFVVVEAAGNGNENLDDPVYAYDPDHPHRPFVVNSEGVRINDSGAIIVGAGFANWGWYIEEFSLVPRERKEFSNFGRRVDVQGWGEHIVTLGPGLEPDKTIYFDDQGMTIRNDYRGTSGATAILGGVATSLQGIVKAHDLEFTYLSSKQMRELLIETGTAQQGDLNEHIGLLPDMRQAINTLLATNQELIVEPWDLYCGGWADEIPPLYEPEFSVEPGSAQGTIHLKLRFGGGVYVEGSSIFYTTNGVTEPDVECAGEPGCEATGIWTLEHTQNGAVLVFTQGDLPVLVKAKTGIPFCWIQDNVVSETAEILLE